MQPNDTDTRSDSLRDFYTQRLPNDVTISKFASHLGVGNHIENGRNITKNTSIYP